MDILSGSYSRMEQDMAGLFQVFWGTEDGEFKKPEPVQGTDGEPLIIPAEKNLVTEKICTRPTAADIDGDGDLDLVVGNFAGSFYVFEGNGNGEFSPEPSQMMVDDKPLTVPHHSDPFLVDWDTDGDLDLVSGSASGGAFLSINEGNAQEPKFSKMTELVKPNRRNLGQMVFGDAHVTGPQGSTRVYVDDVNGDGKLDLLLGDSVTLTFPGEGLDKETALAKLEDWNKQQQEIIEKMQRRVDPDDENAPTADEMKAQQQKYQEHWQARKKIVTQEMTGYVWVLYQK